MKRYIELSIALILWALSFSVAAGVCGEVEEAIAGQEYDARVEEHLDQADIDYEVDADGDFRLKFSYQGGRSQLVIVNSGTEHYRGMETREVWAYGYVAESRQIDEAIVRYLMAVNAEVKLGAWQVQYSGDTAVVSFRAMIAADAGADTLMATLLLVAVAADKMEADITGEDVL